MNLNFQQPIFLSESIQVLLDHYNEQQGDGKLECKNYQELNKTILLLQENNIFSFEDLKARIELGNSCGCFVK